MRFNPLPHQVVISNWLNVRPRGALFCGCGVGKTAATLHHLDELFSRGAVTGALVIAPLRVSRLTWPEQIEQWDHSNWMRHVNLNTPEGEQAWRDGSAQIYLTHFHTLPSKTIHTKCRKCGMKGCDSCDGGIITRNYPGVIERLFKGLSPTASSPDKRAPVNCLIIDESSCLKSPSGKWSKFLRAAVHHFEYRYLLTGTPVCNSYLDLFNPMRLLDDGERLGKSYYQFRQTYFRKPYAQSFDWQIKPGAKEKIDAKIADICLSMSSEEWLKVPTTHINDIEIKLPAAARKHYDRMEKDLLIELENTEIVALNAAVKVGKLLQLTSGHVYSGDPAGGGASAGAYETLHTAKIDALIKLRKELGKEPLLVMTAYKHETERILAAIPEARGFDEKDIPDWRAGRIPVFVANPASMAHGIDGLQMGGKHIVWMTLTYSSELYHQANARLVRQGQQHETTIHRLLVEDSIDWAVLSAVERKSDDAKNLLTALKNLQRLRRP